MAARRLAREAILVLGALVAVEGSAALGQPLPPSSPATIADGGPRAIDELLARLSMLQQTVDRQGEEIADLRRLLHGAGVPASGAIACAPAQAPAPESALQSKPTLPSAEPPPQRIPELPPDVVSAGEFPGSFTIPGSDAALRIGGLVRVNWVSTNNALIDVQDRFVTSAIPVEGATGGAGGARVDVIASPSRFNFDLRTPTGVGHMRAFIEGDFAGTAGVFRLRHAYGQWRRLIFGQTWSTYSDPEAEPDGIDFEGLNAIVLFRQPQVRWTIPAGERTRVALAFEDPRADLTGATSVGQVPDIIGRVRFEPRRGGHVQMAGVVRQLRGEPFDRPMEIVGATGYGVNVSGRLPSPIGPDRDALLFQSNHGAGIGRYITDLATLGGQDAIYDPAMRTLEALVAFSGYVGYEHAWTPLFRSSFSFGIVDVDNRQSQPDDALHLTRRYSVNFMWSPITRMDLVTELLWGSRINRDGRKGTAAQTQIGATFRF